MQTLQRTREMVKLGFTKEEIMSNLQHKVEELYRHSETWVEAIVEYCQEFDLDETDVIPYLSPIMLDRLKKEAVLLKRLKRTEEATLPFN